MAEIKISGTMSVNLELKSTYDSVDQFLAHINPMIDMCKRVERQNDKLSDMGLSMPNTKATKTYKKPVKRTETEKRRMIKEYDNATKEDKPDLARKYGYSTNVYKVTICNYKRVMEKKK